jgi:hypothetical protein
MRYSIFSLSSFPFDQTKPGCTSQVRETLYIRIVEDKRWIVPIDLGAREMSPAYVLRIFRQFGFTDKEIEKLLR